MFKKYLTGDEEATWVDLYNVMYRERTLFLGQEIRCEITNHITGLMVYLSIEDGIRDIFLFINSPGGWLISGMAIFDTMQTVTPDIYTICLGIAASMASFILLGGEPTKRIAFPHARIMLHLPDSLRPAQFSDSQVPDCEVGLTFSFPIPGTRKHW